MRPWLHRRQYMPRAGALSFEAVPGGAPGIMASGRQQGSLAHREDCSIILQQPLDVIELLLRAGDVAEALAQFLDDAAGALHVDLARHLAP